ncbi:unnamed protein product, partial [marine sediment metagenome]
MKAIIVGVGDELIAGQTVNTNSAHLSHELGRLGIETLAHWTIGDCRGDIAAAVTKAAE